MYNKKYLQSTGSPMLANIFNFYRDNITKRTWPRRLICQIIGRLWFWSWSPCDCSFDIDWYLHWTLLIQKEWENTGTLESQVVVENWKHCAKFLSTTSRLARCYHDSYKKVSMKLSSWAMVQNGTKTFASHDKASSSAEKWTLFIPC